MASSGAVCAALPDAAKSMAHHFPKDAAVLANHLPAMPWHPRAG